MRIDPNWLLSTTAQSSAAIVGIIGGLLVSRIVALASERSALRRQERELTDRRDVLWAELEPMEEALRLEVEDEFDTEATDHAVMTRATDPFGLIERFAPDGWGEHLWPAAERIVAEVAEAYARCESCPERPIDPDRISELVDVPEGREDMYRAVAQRVRRTQMRDVGPLDFDWPRLGSVSGRALIGSMPNPNEVSRRGLLRDAVRDVDLQLSGVRASLGRIGDITGLMPTLMVLGIFALVGIVQPIAMLALRPIPASVFARGWVVVSFTLALAALLWFLWREIDRLTRFREPEKPSLEPRLPDGAESATSGGTNSTSSPAGRLAGERR